jgi:hypothetical protein
MYLFYILFKRQSNLQLISPFNMHNFIIIIIIIIIYFCLYEYHVNSEAWLDKTFL